MIGTQEEANEITEWFSEYSNSGAYPPEGPEGWRWLGGGCYRDAFLAPSGVVYKVGSSWSNENEVESSRKARERLAGSLENFRAYIPEADLFNVGNGSNVVAMEFVKGNPTSCASDYNMYVEGKMVQQDCDCNREECIGVRRRTFAALVEAFFSDMHDGNVLETDDGTLVPVDMGC